LPLSLPKVAQSQLDVRPIDWRGLPQTFMNRGELEVLIALVASVEPKAVLEIGVNEGRTAKAILANVPGIEKYIGIDVPPGYVTAREVQRKEVPEKPGHLASSDGRFELVLRPRGSMDLSEKEFPGLFDAVFIDGDHGFEAVLHDTLLAGRSSGRKASSSGTTTTSKTRSTSARCWSVFTQMDLTSGTSKGRGWHMRGCDMAKSTKKTKTKTGSNYQRPEPIVAPKTKGEAARMIRRANAMLKACGVR